MPDIEMLVVDLMSAKGIARDFEQFLKNIGIYDEKEIRHWLEDYMTVIGKTAHGTYQAAVPYWKGQLRNNIKLESRNRVQKKILLRGGPHDTSNTKDILDNTVLADLLDDGISRYGTPFRRRRNALKGKITFYVESTAKGEPTARWSDKAYKAFDQWLEGYCRV